MRRKTFACIGHEACTPLRPLSWGLRKKLATSQGLFFYSNYCSAEQTLYCSMYFTIGNRTTHCSYLVPQLLYTIIRFVSVSANFGTCTVVGLNGTLVEAKMSLSPLNVRILSNVQFTPTTVQMPNLGLVANWQTIPKNTSLHVREVRWVQKQMRKYK